MTTSITNMTAEQQKEILAKLAKLEEKESKARKTAERARVRAHLMVEKAKAANITVTELEVDKYIANMKK